MESLLLFFLTFSTDLSGLDLPDLTIGNVASITKGLRRKRPRQCLNVTAFEKRLKDGDGNVMDFTHNNNNNNNKDRNALHKI